MSSPIGNGSMLVFKRGKDKGTLPDVRALQEVGMLLGNALVEESLLKGRGQVWVDYGRVGRQGEGSHVARRRDWGGGRTRMEGCLDLKALDLEDRQP